MATSSGTRTRQTTRTSSCASTASPSTRQVLGDPERYMPLYFCMASQPRSAPERSSYSCMQQLSIQPEPIRECVRSPTADEEMYKIVQADLALNTRRTYVPWVVVNGKHVVINDGYKDLKRALCAAMGPNAPTSCSQTLVAMVPEYVQREAAVGAAGLGVSYWMSEHMA
mmetsp:Transcript_48133/g.148570  ORF Transcript_48133/g.148570 Transcript_48133/m.148570 type:complete len:169 (-) Transcript_48133:20-526(-)